jgi:hypothetical protein
VPLGGAPASPWRGTGFACMAAGMPEPLNAARSACDSGYGREHAPETLRTHSKMIPFPTGLAAIPQWRAVTDISGP